MIIHVHEAEGCHGCTPSANQEFSDSQDLEGWIRIIGIYLRALICAGRVDPPILMVHVISLHNSCRSTAGCHWNIIIGSYNYEKINISTLLWI